MLVDDFCWSLVSTIVLLRSSSTKRSTSRSSLKHSSTGSTHPLSSCIHHSSRGVGPPPYWHEGKLLVGGTSFATVALPVSLVRIYHPTSAMQLPEYPDPFHCERRTENFWNITRMTHPSEQLLNRIELYMPEKSISSSKLFPLAQAKHVWWSAF